MRFFSLVDLQQMILVVFLGLVSFILVYMAWGSYPYRRRALSEEQLKEQEGHERKSGLKAENNPIAPFLILVYVGVILWALAYAIYIGVLGGPIG